MGHHLVHELGNLEDISILRGDLVDFLPQLLQGFHDEGLRVECLFDIVLLQADGGGVHVLFSKQHHRAGFDLVRQGIEGGQHGIDGVDQVLLRDDEAKILLWLGFLRNGGQLSLLVLDLRQQRARGEGAPGDLEHAGEGGTCHRQLLDQGGGLLDHVERLLLEFDGVVWFVVLEQRAGGAHGTRDPGEGV